MYTMNGKYSILHKRQIQFISLKYLEATKKSNYTNVRGKHFFQVNVVLKTLLECYEHGDDMSFHYQSIF